MKPRRAKIVVTLGPATDGLEHDLVAGGLDVARLNFSHGLPREHADRCARIRAAAAALSRHVAVMQDLQGPKLRVGRLKHGGPVTLEQGQTLVITTADVLGDETRISCTYKGLPADVHPGDRILLDDGRLRLSVVRVMGHEVETRIEEGGSLGEHKGINLPGVTISAPALTDMDRHNLEFGIAEMRVDYVGLSFIRTAAEVRQARALVRQLGGNQPLVTKIEKAEAIDDLDAILRASDAVMVARGDLGVELPPERVPMLQKTIIRAANARGIPVITATQMLESMTQQDTPTRAEAADVANAVWDGSDAVMLSGETAVGHNPRLVLAMMDRIVRSAEAANVPARPRAEHGRRTHSPAAAVAHAAKVLADDLGATAIIVFTRTGRTGHLLSADRPGVPVYTFSQHEQTCRRLALWWGICPTYCALKRDLDANIAAWEAAPELASIAGPGNAVVIVGSHPFERGVHTNFVKYHTMQPASPASLQAEEPQISAPRP